ncbi:hypothetical protein [Corynebacterium variabile]|uniref:hypothetical protein n=1 Tax=Corynebacterium variabile TaxID=1727 RepID=UPI003A8F17DC
MTLKMPNAAQNTPSFEDDLREINDTTEGPEWINPELFPKKFHDLISNFNKAHDAQYRATRMLSIYQGEGARNKMPEIRRMNNIDYLERLLHSIGNNLSIISPLIERMKLEVTFSSNGIPSA